MSYDSTQATLDHIAKVEGHMSLVADMLRIRGRFHDSSKLQSPEKELYDEWTPKLSTMTYGSDEYKAGLQAMGPALQHHYQNNSHHPEHYPNGINDMDLLDIVEMLCDWAAAAKRHANGDLSKSIEINSKRFNIEPQLTAILVSTAKRIGWIE